MPPLSRFRHPLIILHSKICLSMTIPHHLRTLFHRPWSLSGGLLSQRKIALSSYIWNLDIPTIITYGVASSFKSNFHEYCFAHGTCEVGGLIRELPLLILSCPPQPAIRPNSLEGGIIGISRGFQDGIKVRLPREITLAWKLGITQLPFLLPAPAIWTFR